MILRDGILFVFSNDIWFPESLKVIHVMHNICENYCTGKTRERLTSSTRYNVYECPIQVISLKLSLIQDPR